MAIPTSYLTSTKNLQGILSAIQQAKAPDRFTQRFLEELEFKSTSDRLIIGVLKSLRFIDDQGKPKDRYFQFLDQSLSDRVMARSRCDDRSARGLCPRPARPSAQWLDRGSAAAVPRHPCGDRVGFARR